MTTIYTEQDIMELTNKLENAGDKFILAGLFYGLVDNGKKENIVTIKTSQVDLENSTITLDSGRVFTMNRFLKKIVEDAIEETVYYKIGTTSGAFCDSYELNPASPYIVKSRPLVGNDYGVQPMSVDGFQTRLKSLSNYLVGDYSLNATTIKQSGAYHVLESMGRRGTYAECEKKLKENGLSIRRNIIVEMLLDIYGENPYRK